MSTITKHNLRTANLLMPDTRVEAPFVRVSIGGYTFGVYEEKSRGVDVRNGHVKTVTAKYPNYIQNLSINKINGTVNTYSLSIKYPITENNDPNFFEKIFSSISDTRKIYFTYGDSMLPEYVYKDEEAIITKVQNTFDIKNPVITYTIDAVSTSSLALSGSYTFPTKYAKPSDEIIRLVNSSKYHLKEVFTGMRGKNLEELIMTDDKMIQIPTRTNTSILDYINYLVSCMTPVGSSGTSAIKSSVYALVASEDTTGTYGGPYFKVQKVQSAYNVLNQLTTYSIDIGYPTSNIVTDFTIDQNENWSIYYNYNRSLDNSDYLKRIDSKGEPEYIYSPQLTGGKFEMKSSDSTWWTKVTQYPIKAKITLKGLLKPAILMQYVKLNVWYFGHKHVSSGYYIITAQKDNIGMSGYTTTLSLLRVSEDEEMM